MARRYYSSTAVETTLSGAISNSATSITVTALSGFPNTTPWTAIIDADTASEELVEVTNVAGTTLTVTRGVDGTAAVSHNAGASFRHGVSARDFDEANDHVNDSTGVHGLGASSSVVGTTDTQTLTNKTIDIASNTLTGVAPVANPTFTGVASFPDGSASDPSITNTGDTNTGVFFPAADSVGIATGGSERVRVNSSGQVGIGTTSAGQPLDIQSGSFGVLITRYNASVGGGIALRRSRNATVGSLTAVQSGDALGRLNYNGTDGSTFIDAAEIRGEVDGTVSTGVIPTRLNFYTTTDAGASTERMRIDRNGLITGTGTSLGAWTAYTPTLGGFTLGNGTITGFYCQIGKLVFFRARFVFGSTSVAASSNISFTLPVTAVAGVAQTLVGSIQGGVHDASGGAPYATGTFLNTTTTVALRVVGTDGALNLFSSTSPFTWTDGDSAYVSGVYQAA